MTRRTASILGGILIFGLATIGGAIAFARLDEFHPWKVALFGRPDVMKPKLGMTHPSGETYPVTLYEYTDRDHFVTNGRGVTYSFPPAYYYYALMPAPDDAAMRFQVRFDLETGASWLDAPPELREFELDAATREEVYRRKVEATLSIFAHPLAEPSELVEAKSRGAVNVEDIDTTSKVCSGDYRWIGKQYCGYEMFEFCTRGNPLAREAQAYPFNTAAIFALPDGSGSFSTVVECNHTAELGWCSVQRPHAIARSFRVNFGGANLCNLERPVAAAEKLLADHLSKETAPQDGWGLPYEQALGHAVQAWRVVAERALHIGAFMFRAEGTSSNRRAARRTGNLRMNGLTRPRPLRGRRPTHDTSKSLHPWRRHRTCRHWWGHRFRSNG